MTRYCYYRHCRLCYEDFSTFEQAIRRATDDIDSGYATPNAIIMDGGKRIAGNNLRDAIFNRLGRSIKRIDDA